MKISVVIPCYNGEETLHETLEAIAAQQWDKEWEVVFSDNGSTDNSRNIAESFTGKIPLLRVIDSSAERGQPFAMNNGVEHSRGESVIFCDADDIPLEGWLAAMGEALESSSLVACRTDTTTLNPEWAVAARPNPQDTGLNKVSYPPYLHHAGGGTMGVKRILHEQLGGFDPAFPYLHDTDFCFKAQLAGHDIKFVEKAVLCYRFKLDLLDIYRQSKGYAEYNVRLSKKYRLTGKQPPQRWRHFFKEISGVVKFYFRKGIGKKANAIFCKRLGWSLGRLKGVVKYRVPPF